MNRWTRAVAVVALVAGTTAIGTGADAQTEGASASIYAVEVVVRGTPPPGAQIQVETPGVPVGDEQHTIVLADIAGSPDGSWEVGTIFRQLYVLPENDAGAALVAYACTMTGGPMPPDPVSDCTVHETADAAAPGRHVDANFRGNANATALVTITLTFGRCGGQPVTTFIGAGDTPTAGNDVILGTAGANTINGLGGDDRICGGGGPDILRGGSGTDRIFGANGADRLEGGLHGDRLFGQAGNDTMLGQDGTDLLDGGANRDTCNGGPGVDQGPRCEVTTAIP